MNQGPLVERVNIRVIPPRYGWDTPEDLTSSDDEAKDLEVAVRTGIINEEVEAELDDNVNNEDVEFKSPERILSWDNYVSPPSFSTASLEEVLDVLDDDDKYD